MSSCLEAAIKATNDFLRDQRDEVDGTADLTITLFDDRIEHPFVAADIMDVPDLIRAHLRHEGPPPCSMPLAAHDRLGERLGDLPEAKRPGTVIVAILTDGYENASTEFDWRDIAKKIRHQEGKYSWQFLFLAAGADAIAQASKIGIARQNASAFANDKIGHAASAKAYSGKVRAMRASAHRELSREEKNVTQC